MEKSRKPGRPPVPPDKKLVHRTLRLTRSQWAKIDLAGLPALRALLELWQVKKP